MKYALVIVEGQGVHKGTKAQAIREFSDSIDSLVAKNEGVERLNIGAYLVSLEHGLRGLTQSVDEAEGHKLGLRTLFFEETPSFVVTPELP